MRYHLVKFRNWSNNHQISNSGKISYFETWKEFIETLHWYLLSLFEQVLKWNKIYSFPNNFNLEMVISKLELLMNCIIDTYNRTLFKLFLSILQVIWLRKRCWLIFGKAPNDQVFLNYFLSSSFHYIFHLQFIYAACFNYKVFFTRI